MPQHEKGAKSTREKGLAAPGGLCYLIGESERRPPMARSLTDSLKHDRYSVVAVDKAAGRLRIKSEAEMCSEFACGEALVVTDEGRTRDLDEINPGDIVIVEHADDKAKEIRVVRRVFDEYSSPEW